MNIKHSTLAAAVTAALVMGASGQAAANVYALSSLSVRDVQINITPTSGAGFSAAITNFDFTITNTATLNGVSAPVQTATCGGLPGPGNNTCGTSPVVLDAAAANAPGGTAVRANNDLTQVDGSTLARLGPGTFQYATSDSVIVTAELVNLGFPTSTHQIAESELQGTGTASSNAEIQSQSGFLFQFTTNGAFSLNLSFKADPDMLALVDMPSSGNNAQGNMTASFTLSNDDTGESVSWSPQGTPLANDCNVSGFVSATCTETADTEDLNRNVGQSANGQTGNSYDGAFPVAGFGAYGINVAGLTAGRWTLTLNTVTSTRLRAVPEPGMLALLGIGLVGMGMSARRKKLA